jgi:hypothetical protein
MNSFLETKANKRKLRQLAGVAYERELGAELSKLEAEFARWRRGEIDPCELSDRAHDQVRPMILSQINGLPSLQIRCVAAGMVEVSPPPGLRKWVGRVPQLSAWHLSRPAPRWWPTAPGLGLPRRTAGFRRAGDRSVARRKLAARRAPRISVERRGPRRDRSFHSSRDRNVVLTGASGLPQSARRGRR